MKQKNMWKAVIAVTVALAFVLPGTAVFAYDKELKNSVKTAEIDTAGLYPFPYRNEKSSDISIFPTPDTLNFGALGDTFYAYIEYDAGGVLPNGPVSFQSDNPGTITLLKPTTSSSFISGGTWVDGIWYGCQYDTGWLWTIDKITGDMTLIGGGGSSLSGLAYDPITRTMYGAGGYDLYVINMSNGGQMDVGPFNNGGVMIGIAFDGNGNLYGEDIQTDSLYRINTSTGVATLIGLFGMDLGYAQDMAYDIDHNILYLSAFTTGGNGYLCTCNVATGALTIVGGFQRNAEIDGFAIPYTISQPPETPQRPNGPTEGIVNYNYTFSTITTDPEGNHVYYKWNWSDGTFSNWLGPYDSGDVVLVRHTWTGAGTYVVRVKAKDIYSHESSWSDPKTIHIVNRATLEIGNITGGVFKVNAVIRNTGGVDAPAVNWSITLDGGFILMGKETSGKTTGIPAGGEVTISSDFIFGFGKTVIIVSAETAGSSDTKEQDAFVLLFFIR